MQKLDQGYDPKRYKVILRSLIFIFFENELLMIKGASNKKTWANLFNGIGGHVERGEDIISSARRELFEETGIMCGLLENRGTLIIDIDNDEGILVFIFTGNVDSKSVRSGIEGELQWIPIDQIMNFPLVEDLYTLIPKVLDSNIRFISGHYHYENDKLVMQF
ncbi:MAG: NUDIX hydrolase [Anaerolineaceae bacterium]|jgi:8-oxo-dGTP diphosphatase|nr:MAG: hypothetical protein CVU46_14610 [Chloroflexi bacterium HGW-Chloroflexi-8]